MSDLLPIVPGCLCWFFDPGHPWQGGFTVTAIEYVGVITGEDRDGTWNSLPDNDCWMINKDVIWSDDGTGENMELLPFSPTRLLMRIDGHKEDEHDLQEIEA